MREIVVARMIILSKANHRFETLALTSEGETA